MGAYIWLAVDIAFLCYFLSSVAHEKGWFSARVFSFALPMEIYGRDSTFFLILDSAFAALWVYFLVDDVLKLITGA